MTNAQNLRIVLHIDNRITIMRLLLAVIAVLLWIDFMVYDTNSLVVWFLYFADGIVHDIKWYFYTV